MTEEDAAVEAGAAATGPMHIPTPPAGARSRLLGATAGMALGTTLSRITGVGRIMALTAALSGGGFADAYNLANTTPNIITDIVIGGVLAATFVPVFVSELTTKATKEAWEAISSVVTVTVTIVLVATVAFFVLTPSIIDLYTSTNHHASAHQQQVVATFLLRWFVPQLTCYGLIALMTALLNTQGKFAAPMFVPIANNLIVIGMLLWFHALVPNPNLATIQAHHTALLLLGIGTTVGVVVQGALLVPSLLRSDLQIRFRWQPGHEAVRKITRLAGWTFGIVVANQIALVVILALADGARIPGAVSAYTYAYAFFQLPYGIIAVSVMSAVTPSLSARWAVGDIAGFRHRMTFGLRSILVIIIPSAVGMIILAHPLIDLILAHGAETAAQASTTAATLAMFSLGLPGFCTFLYMVRVLQAMQDTRTAFRIYLLQNALNIVLGVALVGSLGVRGLALSVAVSYSVAAIIALSLVAKKEKGLGGHDLTTPVTRVLISTAVMAVAILLAVNVSGATSGFALLARVVFAVVVGAAAFVGTTVLLASREARRVPELRVGGPEVTSSDAADRLSDGLANADPDDGAGSDTPRQRAALASVRLVTPDVSASGDISAAYESEVEDRPADDSFDESGDQSIDQSTDQSSDHQFRERLGSGTDVAPVRHLRPVPVESEDASPGVLRGDLTAAGRPADQPGAIEPPTDEE